VEEGGRDHQPIADLEKNPFAAASTTTRARILRDEVKSLDEAIDISTPLGSYFAISRKRSPTPIRRVPEAFEAIDKICTGKKDFKTQERNYARC